MKKLYLVLLMTMSTVMALAQSNSNVTLPSNPGMSIIGVQTSEFSEPGNYAGIYANLISPIIANNGTVPSDLAIELSPYYISNPIYQIDEIDHTNFYRDLKISIASTQVTNDSLGNFSRMGIGFQTYLYGGSITEKYHNEIIPVGAKNNLKAMITDLESMLAAGKDSISSEYRAMAEQQYYSSFREDIRSEVQKLMAGPTSDALTRLKEILPEIEVPTTPTSLNAARRNGSFLQLAGAFSLDFPENSFSYSNVERWGIWLDYTHQWIDKSESKYALSFITRVSNYSFDPTVLLANNPLFFDAGIGIYFDIPSQRLLIKGEYVGKLGLSEIQLNEDGSGGTFSSSTESKWSFSIGYKLPDDNTVLSFSLSDVNANADYVQNQATQFLLGLSTALVTQKPE